MQFVKCSLNKDSPGNSMNKISKIESENISSNNEESEDEDLEFRTKKKKQRNNVFDSGKEGAKRF